MMLNDAALTHAVDRLAALTFTGTDQHGALSVTINGTGQVVSVRVDPAALRRLPTRVFESGVRQAMRAALQAAAADDGPVMSALREQGIDPATARTILQ